MHIPTLTIEKFAARSPGVIFSIVQAKPRFLVIAWNSKQACQTAMTQFEFDRILKGVKTPNPLTLQYSDVCTSKIVELAGALDLARRECGISAFLIEVERDAAWPQASLQCSALN